MGLVDTSLSPAVTRMIGRTAAMVSFAESRALLQELAGLAVDAKQVERAAEALGRAIAADEQHIVTPGAPDEPVAPTLYLGMDGTGVPMRATAVKGRAGKQPDGTANTREVKLVTVWSAEGRAADGTPVRDAGSVTYSAAIESAAQKDTDDGPSPFAARVEREATRRGFNRAARRAVLGDGATWIWNLADEHFPDAVQIVDRFHAKQHLSDVGKAIYGATSDLAAHLGARSAMTNWMRANSTPSSPPCAHTRTTTRRARCADYVERNRHRMQYPACRAAGLCTSTGVVEAGCKVAIGTRLKRTGCTGPWPGADAIIALRCCLLSGRYEDFAANSRQLRHLPATMTLRGVNGRQPPPAAAMVDAWQRASPAPMAWLRAGGQSVHRPLETAGGLTESRDRCAPLPDRRQIERAWARRPGGLPYANCTGAHWQ